MIVGNTVLADIVVLGKNTREIEVAATGVIQRQHALIAIGRIGVEGTRLESLQQLLAKPGSIALKNQAAVQAEGRQRAIGALAAIAHHAVRVIPRRMQHELRCDEGSRRQKGTAQLSLHIAALTIVHRLACQRPDQLKARGIRDQTEVQPMRQLLRRVAVLELGHHAVRWCDQRIRILQRLVARHIETQRTITLGPAQAGRAGQQTLAHRNRSQSEIPPVIIIADTIQIQVQTQPAKGRVNHGPVLPGIAPAIPATQIVARHVAGVCLA